MPRYTAVLDAESFTSASDIPVLLRPRGLVPVFGWRGLPCVPGMEVASNEKQAKRP
jgi:hypothetical protein